MIAKIFLNGFEDHYFAIIRWDGHNYLVEIILEVLANIRFIFTIQYNKVYHMAAQNRTLNSIFWYLVIGTSKGCIKCPEANIAQRTLIFLIR